MYSRHTLQLLSPWRPYQALFNIFIKCRRWKSPESSAEDWSDYLALPGTTKNAALGTFPGLKKTFALIFNESLVSSCTWNYIATVSIRDHLVPGCHDDVGLQTELKRNQFYPKDISDRNYCYHWWFTSWFLLARIKWVGEFKSDLKCWFGENAERVENPRSCSILISEDHLHHYDDDKVMIMLIVILIIKVLRLTPYFRKWLSPLSASLACQTTWWL